MKAECVAYWISEKAGYNYTVATKAQEYGFAILKNGYDFRTNAKELGFYFVPKTREWEKKLSSKEEMASILSTFKGLGVISRDITKK